MKEMFDSDSNKTPTTSDDSEDASSAPVKKVSFLVNGAYLQFILDCFSYFSI